ncbi:MAG: hypothetical protein WC460_04325 [Patescibacteria group bacterium]
MAKEGDEAEVFFISQGRKLVEGFYAYSKEAKALQRKIGCSDVRRGARIFRLEDINERLIPTLQRRLDDLV